ncbi:MAG: hypothetical protein H6807_02500 [Planctomycetes bacterium]|nr:hypothetical protein [Planctomycetota bacterium]
MKTTIVTILALVLGSLCLPAQGFRPGKLDLPTSRSGRLDARRPDQSLCLIRILDRGLSGRGQFQTGSGLHEAKDLEAILAGWRARMDEGQAAAPLARVELVIEAERRAPVEDLLTLLGACASPKVAIWRISLRCASAPGDPKGTMRLLPIDLPVDLPDHPRASDAAGRPATAGDWIAALDDLPRGTSLGYRMDGDDLPVKDFAAALFAARTAKPGRLLTLSASAALPIGDLVPLIDLLRLMGYSTGGADAPATELAFTTTTPRPDERSLVISASTRSAIVIEETIEEVDEPSDVEIVEDEVVVEEPVEIDEESVDHEIVPSPVPDTRTRGRKHARRGRGARLQLAVDRGLAWLARHQNPDGSWDTDGFPDLDDGELGPPCDGKGQALYDVSSTGLALLCFFGAGETHRSGEHRKTIARGLKWLRDHQDAEGCFGDRKVANFSYNHAIGTLAMVEAYGLTGSPLFKDYARRGIDFALACQNPYQAWRYGKADGQNDTSVTGWMIMALKSGQQAGFQVDPQRFSWALSWIDQMTDAESGRTGYIRRGEPPVREVGAHEDFPASESESLTALAILTRVFCGERPTSNELIGKGRKLLLAHPPLWDEKAGSIDMYYWLFGSMALHQVGGEDWTTWRGKLSEAILPRQRTDGNFAGSWDPKGAWGKAGGRIYATALMTLALESDYRLQRLFE